MAQFLAYWLEHHVTRTAKPKTYRSYEQVVRLYLVPHIGHVQLDKLTPGHLQRMVNDLGDTDLAPRTVRYTLTVLGTALTVAVKQGIVGRNVARLVDAPSVPRFEGQALTPDQAETLLAQVEGHRLAALYHVAVFRGLRQGELLSLRWSDVDLKAGTLRVADSKTDAGRRTIPLGAALVQRLEDHWRWQQEERRIQGVNWREHSLVFPSSVGTPIGARILGHSQIAVTMEISTHAQLDDMRAALDRLDRGFSG
jgi:integrase